MHSQKKSLFYPVLLTYFLDNFGLAIVYPIFTPLFLHRGWGMLDLNATAFQRTALLGVAIAIFPLAQFFGSPLIGELSDRFGRKKAFCATILGTCIGYALTGLSIALGSFLLLLVGRLWTGFFAGNLTICLAAIADVSLDEEARTKNFGILAAVGGLSFILAILIGGSFAAFAPSLPFWLTSFLSLMNFFCMLSLFKESHPSRAKGGLHLLQGIHNILTVLKQGTLCKIYLIYFFFMICWSTSMQFLPAFLFERYAVSRQALILTFVGIGAIWSLSNLTMNRWLARFFSPPKALAVCLVSLSALLLSMLLPQDLLFAILLFFGAAFFGALSWTYCFATVSLSAGQDIQGRILGINQSVGAVAGVFAPSLAGMIAGFGTHFVYLFTSLAGLIAALILHSLKKVSRL